MAGIVGGSAYCSSPIYGRDGGVGTITSTAAGVSETKVVPS